MATVPHVISGLGLRKFQADGFLLTRVYDKYLLRWKHGMVQPQWKHGMVQPQCLTVSWSETDPAMSQATQPSVLSVSCHDLCYSHIYILYARVHIPVCLNPLLYIIIHAYILSNPDTAPPFIQHSLWCYVERRQDGWEDKAEDVSNNWMTFRKSEDTGSWERNHRSPFAENEL